MAELDDIDAVNRQIRNGSPDALTALRLLPSPCVLDSAGQSPLNVAIQFINAEVMTCLFDDEEALEYAPAVHPADKVKFIRMIYSTEGTDDIDLAEQRVLEPAGVSPYWQRTPLLQACRY